MCTCLWRAILFLLNYISKDPTFHISDHFPKPVLNEYAWRREEHFPDYRQAVLQVTGKLCSQSGVPV